MVIFDSYVSLPEGTRIYTSKWHLSTWNLSIFIFSHRTRVWLKMSGTHQKPMNDHHCPHSMAISCRIPNFQTHPNGILWQSSMPEYIYIYYRLYYSIYIVFFEHWISHCQSRFSQGRVEEFRCQRSATQLSTHIGNQ